jgi:hypothetical protein
VFERFYDAIPIMRSTEEWQVIPGMAIATIAWGLLASFGFAILYEGIPGTGLKKGPYYGLVLWMLFVPFVEVWN